MLKSSNLWDITRVKNVIPLKMGAIASPETSVNITNIPQKSESLHQGAAEA
jgi:hypothetical protein